MAFQTHNSDNLDDLEDNDFLDELDDDEAFSAYRAQRSQELARLVKDVKRNASQNQGYGEVRLVSEKEFFDVTTSNDLVVVHFFHPDFQRCKILNRRLQTVAQQHYETRFVQVDATEAPFLTTKLAIKVLPCLIGYIKGQERFRVVGFEGLSRDGGRDVSDDDLESALERAKLIKVLH